MPTYALERGLPSYVVNRSFLKDAEFFIHKKAKDLLGENYRASSYKIKIQDGLGTQTLASIDEFQYSKFPDDTIAMQLQYEGGMPEYSNIELRLTSEPTLKISIFGESARQQALGMSAELSHVLSPYKSNHYLLNPPDKIKFPLYMMCGLALSFTLTFLTAGLAVSRSKILLPEAAPFFLKMGLSALGVSIILVPYLCGGFFYPYTTFDTKKNQTRQAVAKWFLVSFLGFLLFTVIGVYFRNQLFGF